jgi:hypothetical protein
MARRSRFGVGTFLFGLGLAMTGFQNVPAGLILMVLGAVLLLPENIWWRLHR